MTARHLTRHTLGAALAWGVVARGAAAGAVQSAQASLWLPWREVAR